jgi:hypothetical protein
MKKLKNFFLRWSRGNAGLYGVLVLATPSQAAEPRAYQIREDG